MELTSMILLDLRRLWTLEGEAFKLCPECPILQLAELVPDLWLWESLAKAGTSLVFHMSPSCVVNINCEYKYSIQSCWEQAPFTFQYIWIEAFSWASQKGCARSSGIHLFWPGIWGAGICWAHWFSKAFASQVFCQTAWNKLLHLHPFLW